MNFKKIIIIFSILCINTVLIAENLAHPCLSANLIQAPIKYREALNYYDKTNDKNKFKSFSNYIQSSYLFNQYQTPMSIIREVINYDFYIETSNNPRYYFLKAIEDIIYNNYQSALFFLNEFINSSDNYIKGNFKQKGEYFIKGCSVEDIDWIENRHNDSKEYRISLLLIDYLNDTNTHNELILKLEKLDDNSQNFDLFDNIILVIMNNHNYKIQDYRKFFNKINKIQLNQLVFSDGVNYPLTSQLSALSMFKYFQAENNFNSIEKNIYFKYIDEIDIDSYNHKFLFPLMYYFELKIDFFNEYDSDLYTLLKEVINQIKNMYKNDFDNHYETWINLYSYLGKTLNYERFKNNIFSYQNNLINNKNNPDKNSIKNEFSYLINNNSKVDSIYFTKALQVLNNRDFFYNISNITENSYWMPEVHEDLKNILDDNIYMNESISFSVPIANKTKKVYDSSLLFYYLYDIYSDYRSQEIIKKTIKPTDKINDGIKPLTDSIKILRGILDPSSSGEQE